MSAADLGTHIGASLGRTPLHIGDAAAPIQTIAWCTGAAQGFIEEAVQLGVDAYLTGEVSEQTVHLARENGIHFYAAGHHATERYGARALGEHLAAHFGIEQQFIDIDNPV
jgi:putative NIF3 family GTP cyclohydrolase 1 type 2